MRLDAKNSESIRDFENWVKGELYGPRKEAERDNQMGDMTTISTCNKCGLHYRESLIPHQCAEWTKGRKEAKETQPMSDMLQERESGTTTAGYCDECKGRPHAPWCSEFEPPETEANQLLPDGISSVSAGNEHQPATRGGGDEWSIEGGSLVRRRRIRDSRNYWVADAASDEHAKQILAEHNAHQSLIAEIDALKGEALALVAERERLRQVIRDEITAIRIWQHAIHPRSDVQEGLAISLSKLESALNEQRSTSE